MWAFFFFFPSKNGDISHCSCHLEAQCKKEHLQGAAFPPSLPSLQQGLLLHCQQQLSSQYETFKNCWSALVSLLKKQKQPVLPFRGDPGKTMEKQMVKMQSVLPAMGSCES